MAPIFGFTITSLLALIGLLYVHREFVLNYRHIKLGRRNGMSLEVAYMLVVLITAPVATTILTLLAGLGLGAGLAWAGWLLAAIPVVKLSAAILVVRSLRKQVRIYREAHRLSVNP